MYTWYRSIWRAGVGRRLVPIVAALAIASALMLSPKASAQANPGFYRQNQWNWAYNTQHDWNWNQWQNTDWNWNQWDDDWYSSRGTWGNYGLWYGNRWYNGTPTIYTFNKPVYLPQYGRWVVFNSGRPVVSTPHQPIYRPIGNVYVIVNATNVSHLNIDIDIDVSNDFNYVYWRR